MGENPEQHLRHAVGRRIAPLQDTSFKIAYTSDFLLVGIRCAEQEMDKLSFRAEQRDDAQFAQMIPSNSFAAAMVLLPVCSECRRHGV